MTSPTSDPTVEHLAALFRGHPAWVDAADHISRRATSNVYFRHRPGEVWHLHQQAGRTQLVPGPTPDPDFVFRFTPAAVERLGNVQGGIGAFAIELFSCVLDDDPEQGVELRVVAGFTRLAARGYVRLLLAAGPQVLAFGQRHGVPSLGALRRFVAQMRARGPADWETAPENR